MRASFLFLIIALTSWAATAQVVTTDADRAIFAKYKDQFEAQRELPIDQLIINTAMFFLGTPYVAGTLDKEQDEKVIVNLHELDCTTFVEVCFALARTAKSDQFDFNNFCKKLEEVRYRGGVRKGYPSRLHYFSDWIYDNVNRFSSINLVVLRDETKRNGTPYNKRVDFMSTNADKYRLISDNNILEQIKEQENVINARTLYYIPKAKLASLADKVQDGDIIAITTSAKGLDVSHVALAYWKEGKLFFIHASQKLKKVVVNPEPLQTYLDQYASRTGIMLARPVVDHRAETL